MTESKVLSKREEGAASIIIGPKKKEILPKGKIDVP